MRRHEDEEKIYIPDRMLFLGRNMLAVDAAAAVVSAGVTPLGRECPAAGATPLELQWLG